MGLGGVSQPWPSVGSRAVPGDVLPCTETCSSTSCSCCAFAVGQGTPGPQLGPVWLPTAVPESWVLGCVQAQHLPLGLVAPSPSCRLPACALATRSSPVPVCPATPATDTGVTMPMGRTGLHLGRGYSCAALGEQTRMHGRGDAAVFDPTLPPPWHHLHGPQLLRSLGRAQPSCLL